MKDPHPPAKEPAPAGEAQVGEEGGDQALEPAVEDYVVLCRSQGRRDKEQAIRSRSENRYLKALEKLARRVAQGRLKACEKIERAIGRLQRQHPRIQRFYSVKVQGAGKEAGVVQVVWERQDQAYATDDQMLGCYVLRTDRPGKNGAEIWGFYTMLTKAEEGFRALKSELGLRPNYHQIEGRVEGHVFITVLAYHLLGYVLEKLEAREDYRSWTTIKQVLSTHSYATLLLPTQGGKLYRVRRAGQPEGAQKAIYQALEVSWRDFTRDEGGRGLRGAKAQSRQARAGRR